MATHRVSQPEFVWIPGHGPDEQARHHLLQAFPRPTKLMGEAWFMSAERTMYPEALSTPVEKLDLEIVGRMFDQIVCGPPCFGQLEEWQNWFHYLLPRLLPRAFRRQTFTYVAEWLAGGMFSQYPGEIGDEPYRGFQADVFATLGQALMSTAV